MGGEWAAGMPLALEHLPDRLRGAAAGILQGAWAWGYILSALVFQTLYPVLRGEMDEAWRAMFWIGAIPALLVLWIRSKVTESPVWLATQRRAGPMHGAQRAGLVHAHLQSRSDRHHHPLLAAGRVLHGVVLLGHLLVRHDFSSCAG